MPTYKDYVGSSWNGFNAAKPGVVFASAFGATAYEVLEHHEQTHILIDANRLILAGELERYQSEDWRMVATPIVSEYRRIFAALRDGQDVDSEPLRKFCESMHAEIHPEKEVYFDFILGGVMQMFCVAPPMPVRQDAAPDAPGTAREGG